MPALKVQVSADIAANTKQLHDVLVDFHTWPAWSPWLYMEPDTHVDYRGEPGELGHGYDWHGRKVGAGGMTLIASNPRQIDCDLQFLKPFKSFAKVRFDLEEISTDQTRVTWHMDSSLPFFMFFMTGTMTGMIRSDYTRGLALLKDYVERGEIRSQSHVHGVVATESVTYVGYKARTSLTQIGESMQQSFKQLMNSANSGVFTIDGMPFCFYDKMDFKHGQCSYTAALPVTKAVAVELPLVSAVRPAAKALRLTHTGPYLHLGNAWATLMSEARHRKLKVLKSQSPYECYLNDPETTDENELLTELYLPVRG